jgi:hypothetical protein
MPALPPRRPACFDTEAAFAAWCAAARESRHPVRDFCADCTPDHQRRMIASGRCEYPDRAVFPRNDAWRPARVELILDGVLR